MGSVVTPYFLVSNRLDQSRLNDRIAEEVCREDSYANASGLTGEDIRKVCDSLGSKSQDCTDQLDGSEKSGYDEDTTLKYWKAVSKGYKGTIAEFSKKKDTLSKAFGVATGVFSVASGLFSSKSNQGTDYSSKTTDDSSKPKMSLGSILGISLGVVALVGTGLFFALRKK